MNFKKIYLLCLFFFGFASQAYSKTISVPLLVLKKMFVQADCWDRDEEKLVEEPREVLAELVKGKYLISVVCWTAAYNQGEVFLLVNSKNTAQVSLLSFDVWDGIKKKIVKEYSLTAPSYNSKTKTIDSYHKGRGLGDCGASGLWKWNGSNFKLQKYWDKEDCDGKDFLQNEKAMKKWQVYPPKK